MSVNHDSAAVLIIDADGNGYNLRLHENRERQYNHEQFEHERGHGEQVAAKLKDL